MSSLATHIHQSLLTGSCSDITIAIPQWGLKYALHRVVLVQAGFWEGLFEGGFEDVGRDCEVGFGDGNISRRAFEICISRLYSPYPTLKIPPALFPSLTHPLTPSFPHPPLASAPLNNPQTQETSPRLLLSILATAIYLGYNPLIREILGILLASVSPWSVVRYLEFAIGRGIGDDEEEDGPAVGMERVARRYDPDAHERESLRTVASTVGRTASIKTLPRTASPESVDIKKESCATATEKQEDDSHAPPRYFYGFAGEKIGQACVSWLCRWGVDILLIEEEMAAMDAEGDEQRSTSLVGRMRGISLSDARTGKRTTSGHRQSSSWAHATATPERSPISTLRIWARGGLPAEWVRVVISSDAFWIRNEMERYNFAKRVVALRSVDGDDADAEEDCLEEEELQRIFETGIHYSHMTFEQLSQLSSDINPATGLPYVPLGVLQAALWAYSDYQGKITAYRPDGTIGKGDTEVPHNGVALTTKAICELAAPVTPTTVRKAWLVPSAESSRRARTRSNRPAPILHDLGPALGVPPLGPFTSALDRPFWPVPIDSTIRIGDTVSSTNELNPTTGLPDLGPRRDEEGDSPTKAPHDSGVLSGDVDDPYFGFSSPMRTGREILAASQRGMAGKRFDDDALWSRYEPFRFSVEFWGIDKLGEKDRCYSHTVWHAGSYFNIYVQTIRKKDKGVQLGIYLHRQSMLEPVPFPSSSRTPSIAPRPRATAGTDDNISLPWTGSPGNSTPVGGNPHSQPTSNPLTIQRTMSVTPVGSMPRSMSPTGALSDDEGMGRRNGAEPPSAEMYTDRYWARSKRDDNNQKGLNAPYRDPRKTAKVFFSISCASAMGTALTRFSSGPDVFTISQSWGWKSSSLRSQEYSYPVPQAQLPPATSITFADELDPYSPSMERASRPRANRARSGPSISFQANPVADNAPDLSERLDQGVLGWISDPIEPILDSTAKSGDTLKSGFEQWQQKDLRSLRATVVMGVL